MENIVTLDILERRLGAFCIDFQKAQDKKFKDTKNELETRLANAMAEIMATNMSQLMQMMEANIQKMKDTLSSILGGEQQGESGPSKTALGLGSIEQSSASNAAGK
eukprot:4162171-Ditylum_brightwellii.AAC.1